ncbi:hypothetical protein GCM10007981_03600 [Thermocladium modestius]|uniref:Uncharacterized protein n=1 Tax=Thermocladium modestius TaxID=62609 RepID=A0A830GSF6_9CREN|nr:hypothetical protein [Thermocladium modestius]GGP19533.1 hypothetical protein GCM10007981_03600 [Thermocladium modestius]
MMKAVLISISVIFPLLPFIVLLAQGSEAIGLAGIVLVSLVEAFSAIRRGESLNYASWASLISIAFISLLSQGYIPYFFHVVLARVQNTAVFDGSILFPQYSLALSYLYRSYSRYARELSIKGFDEEEVNAELNSLSLSLLIILSSAAAASIALYYVMASLKFLSVDPFTALIIASIFFIYIARYIINKVKGSHNVQF